MDEDCIAVAEGADLLITGGTSHFTVPWWSFLVQGLQVHLQSTQNRSLKFVERQKSERFRLQFSLLFAKTVKCRCLNEVRNVFDTFPTLADCQLRFAKDTEMPSKSSVTVWCQRLPQPALMRGSQTSTPSMLRRGLGSWGILGKLGSRIWVPSAMMPVKWQCLLLVSLISFHRRKAGISARATCQVGGWESQGHWGDVKSSTWFFEANPFRATIHCLVSLRKTTMPLQEVWKKWHNREAELFYELARKYKTEAVKTSALLMHWQGFAPVDVCRQPVDSGDLWRDMPMRQKPGKWVPRGWNALALTAWFGPSARHQQARISAHTGEVGAGGASVCCEPSFKNVLYDVYGFVCWCIVHGIYKV